MQARPPPRPRRPRRRHVATPSLLVDPSKDIHSSAGYLAQGIREGRPPHVRAIGTTPLGGDGDDRGGDPGDPGDVSPGDGGDMLPVENMWVEPGKAIVFGVGNRFSYVFFTRNIETIYSRTRCTVVYGN